jgi:calcium-binding protein CML
MGQNQSRDPSESKDGAEAGKANTSLDGKKHLSSCMASSSGEPSHRSEDSLNRSIHWADNVATDMEKVSSAEGKHFDKKQRVRRRSEDELPPGAGKELQEKDGLSLRSLGSDPVSETLSNYAEDQMSEFEAILVQELKVRVKKSFNSSGGSPKVKNLNSILMKFPQIKDGFEMLRSVFESVDTDHSGDIDFQEWSEAMEQHGLHIDIPEEHQLNVWREADVDGNNLIDFKEFVVVMSFLYLMDYVAVNDSNSESLSESGRGRRIHLHQNVKAAIDLVIDAFLFFDKNGDGRIMKKEVVTGLDVSIRGSGRRSGVDQKGHLSSNIWKKRFEEMDCDHSGTISLKEFIFAFEDWVGFGESDEEE